MASFDEHILQAKKNLLFLSEINSLPALNWEWHVTVSFYVAVHIINAHLAATEDSHYRTHELAKNALNPFIPHSQTAIPEDTYLSYVKLECLSRRARYLIHDDYNKTDEKRAYFTYDIHFTRAIKNLDKLLTYFKTTYSIEFPNYALACPSLNPSPSMNNFKVKS